MEPTRQKSTFTMMQGKAGFKNKKFSLLKRKQLYCILPMFQTYDTMQPPLPPPPPPTLCKYLYAGGGRMWRTCHHRLWSICLASIYSVGVCVCVCVWGYLHITCTLYRVGRFLNPDLLKDALD